MAAPANAKSRRARRPLYFAAKISDYQFRKVLWHFALDHSAREAARHVAISANSINAIYAKLRAYFFETGLFEDIYQGGDPREGSALADEEFEYRLIDFHIKRLGAKRGADDPQEGPPLHFAESHWRFYYALMNEGRTSEALHRMMFTHLMEMMRCCGPVGAPPTNRKAGLQLALVQMDQRILWMGRNSPNFRASGKRADLRDMRDDARR